MSHNGKKAAPEVASEESVTTKSAESQEQPTTAPDGSTAGTFPAARGAEATTTDRQSITVTSATSEVLQGSKMSPEEKQYLTAIRMNDNELGEVIKKPTERINQLFGSAIAHESAAKEERRLAQKEFNANIAYYYEAKQRLLNPKYRPDLNTGQERTEEDNLRNFGAKDWQQFNANCMAYSLQHANAKLKEFAKSQGILTDDGENIDDVETEEAEGGGRPEPLRTEDLTAQKRYEHIATAAMSIATENPEDEVSKQILAAAEYQPAPLMPVPPDVYTEMLSFITKIASSVADDEIKVEAKRLLGKMRLHRPAPDPVKVLDAAQQEEQRKRGKRLARKNGGALGSATYNPPTNGTSHLQGSSVKQNSKSEPEPAAVPANKAKRFWWTERKMGDLAELVIMDGKKVYDFYPMDAIKEVKEVIDKLNAQSVAETSGTAMAAD
jgi:hypothetical protein